MADARELEEQLTVLLAQQGDREAFRRLVDAYDARLLYFVRRILGDADGALDVLQSVWLAVHRRLVGLQCPSAFRVWVYRIAHDLAVTEVRRRTRRPVLFEDVPPEQAADAADDAAFEDAELVHRALLGLSVDHRRVLTLRFLEDMPIGEIAAVVGCGPGTVKSRLHYARAALRRRIEEMLDE
ncbi:MAG: RNA polymerase sigma factor [Gemmataceae bacterium]